MQTHKKKGFFHLLMQGGISLHAVSLQKHPRLGRWDLRGGCVMHGAKPTPWPPAPCLHCLQLYWRHSAWNGLQRRCSVLSEQPLCRRSSCIKPEPSVVCLPLAGVPGEEWFPCFASLTERKCFCADPGSAAQQTRRCHAPRLEAI